jgi:MFS family permease
MRLGYFGELRGNARPLVAASLGAGTSLPFDAYTNSIFAPYLIREFGWSRAQFALYGLVAVATALVLPFVGRFTDQFGVRRVAVVGTLLMPLVFIAYSQMQGSFAYFLALSASKLAIGQMTSSIVYTRLVAANFSHARGLALVIVNCTPAALGAIAAPVLTWNIASFGWRASYIAVGAFMLVCGIVAVALIPARNAADTKLAVARNPDQETSWRRDFGIVARSKVFWIIIAGTYLCMLATPLQSSQMNVMLQDRGLAATTAAWVISVYAISTIVGRIACGLALDRFATPAVTTICLIPAALGLFLLATDMHPTVILAVAMALFGLYVGTENDLLPFLIARYFKLRIYSFCLSLLMLSVYLASATGSLSISKTLGLTESFSPFLYLVSGTVLVGRLLFLLLPRSPEAEKVG